MFFALGASIQGWKHCRPIIVVDGTFLKTKCGGALYAACAKDGNNQVFPIGFGIGDSENDKAWEWFFRRLKEAIGDHEDLCIISDRHKSIENAVRIVYPNAYHGICRQHLKQNLRVKFKSVGVLATFTTAANTYSRANYDTSMSELHNINPEITKYLLEAKPERWARSFYPRKRYNIQTTNIAESFNSVIRQLRELPIAALVESLREIFQEWFTTRRDEAAATFFPVTEWANEELKKKLEKAHRMKVCKNLNLYLFLCIPLLYKLCNAY